MKDSTGVVNSVTVVFATYNGENTLPTMLESLCRINHPGCAWDVIAVDNASTDKTHDILMSYATKLPLRVLEESRRGKNFALNSALVEVSSDLVVFTDDDVDVDPSWLAQLVAAAKANPGHDIFGGRILPKWPEPPPVWLFESVPVRIVYAITAEDLEEGPVHPGRVWGPNMAIRRRIFERGHKFDESVGPSAGNYRMGSETEFTARLANIGHKAWHVRSAIVQHIIRKNQLCSRWIAKRGYRFGRDMFWKENSVKLKIESNGRDHSTPRIFGLPRWYYGNYVRYALASILLRYSGNPSKKLNANWNFQYWRGYFREAWATGFLFAFRGRERFDQ